MTHDFSTIALQLNPRDQVAIAKQAIAAGTIVDFNGARLTIGEDVPAGHKFALADVPAGGEVRRYGHPIGRASRDIPAGAWVHNHNLEVGEVSKEYHYTVVPAPVWSPARKRTFMGYPRPDGRAGTRNYLAVISTVNCSAFVASRIAAYFTPERLAALSQRGWGAGFDPPHRLFDPPGGRRPTNTCSARCAMWPATPTSPLSWWWGWAARSTRSSPVSR